MKEFDVKEVLQEIIKNEFTDEQLIEIHNWKCEIDNDMDSQISYLSKQNLNDLFPYDNAWDVLSNTDWFSSDDDYFKFINGKLFTFDNLRKMLDDYDRYAEIWMDDSYNKFTELFEDEIYNKFADYMVSEYDVTLEDVLNNVCDASMIIDNYESVVQDVLENKD